MSKELCLIACLKLVESEFGEEISTTKLTQFKLS